MTQSFDSATAGLRALLQDVLDAPRSPRGECDAVIAQLDLFVHDELRGVDVRARHPRAWQHLQVCADCRAEHDTLLDLLAAEAHGELAPLPPRRIVASPPVAQPWRLVFEPLADHPRPALAFVFAPAYLLRSLQPAAVGGRRGGLAPPADALILSYLGEAGGGEVSVQVYARPVRGDPAHCTLALIAVGEPMPAAAALAWGGQTWQQPLSPDGDAEFGPLPLAALSHSPAEAFSLRLLP
jgi:hypothetical protein